MDNGIWIFLVRKCSSALSCLRQLNFYRYSMIMKNANFLAYHCDDGAMSSLALVEHEIQVLGECLPVECKN